VADDGRGIAEERPEVVDAAAHAEAVRPAVSAVATIGLVVANVRSADGPGAVRRDIDAAAEAVAPVVAVATISLVVADVRSAKGHCSSIIVKAGVDAAARAVAAVAPVVAVAAEGLVVADVRLVFCRF
jgi:hypothetical protein